MSTNRSLKTHSFEKAKTVAQSARVESEEELSISKKINKFVTNTSKDFGEARKKDDTLVLDSDFKDSILSKDSSDSRETPNEFSFSENMEKPKFLKKSPKDRKKSLANANKTIVNTTRNNEKEKKPIDYAIEVHSSTTPKKIIKNKTISEKLYRLISQFYVIKKFIKNLRNAAFVRFPTKYQINRMYILNDLTFSKEGLNTRPEKTEALSKVGIFFLTHVLRLSKFLLKVYECFFTKLGKYFKVYEPSKSFSSFWDFLHFLVILFNFFKIPVELSFDISLFDFLFEINPGFASFFEKFEFYFLLIDIFVNFNTGYYTKGSLIISRKNIAKHYIKSNFFLDLLSFIPIFFDFQRVPVNENLKILFFIRINNFFRIFSRIEESIHINFKLFNLLTLLKVLARIFLLSHLFACGWHYIAYSNLNQNSENWLAVYRLSDDIWWRKYLSSYYFVCVTMNTVGYGDLVPQNPTEKIYCIFFIYVACGLFAYTLNVVGDIIQKINKNKSQFLNNIMIINEYMNKKNITFDLRMRIRKYLEYVWQEEQYHNSEEEKLIIQKLSTSLKEELLLETNGKALRQIPFLINNFSEDTLRKLVFRLKELHYMPGDIIYEKGDYSNNSLFILGKGEIELYMDISKKDETYQVIEKIEKHKVFGEKEFITGEMREISARSSSFSTVFVLDYHDFISVLLENNQDYFKFIEIKDKTSLYQDYSEIKRICWFCQELTHTILECPLLHLKLFVPRVILKHCYHKPNERTEFLRKAKKDPNARKKKNLNEFVAKTIQKEYLFTEEEGTEFYPLSSERQSSNQEKLSEDNLESSDDASLDFTRTNNTSTPINNNNANSTNNNNNTSYLNGTSANGISLKDRETGNNLTVMNIMGSSQKMNSSKSITKENNLIPILKEAQIRTPSHKESHFNDKKSSDPRIPRYVSENTVTMNNKTEETTNLSKNKLNRYGTGNSLKLLSPMNKEAEKKVEIGRFFEKKMEFENYFPHNNSENVLNIYNSRREYKISFKNFSKKYRRNATRKVLDNELLLVNNIKQPLAFPERKSLRVALSPKKTAFFAKNEDLPIKSEIDRKAIILMLKNKRKGKEKGAIEKAVCWFVNLMKEE